MPASRQFLRLWLSQGHLRSDLMSADPNTPVGCAAKLFEITLQELAHHVEPGGALVGDMASESPGQLRPQCLDLLWHPSQPAPRHEPPGTAALAQLPKLIFEPLLKPKTGEFSHFELARATSPRRRCKSSLGQIA